MRCINFIGSIFALMIACTPVTPARADVGIPSAGLDLSLVFKNVGDFPDHEFYLKYERAFGGARKNLHKVEPGTPMRLEGRRLGLSSIFLIAVPRGEKMAVPEKDDKKWLNNAPPGGLQSQPLKGDAAGNPLLEFNGYDITYRVRIDGDRLEVDCIETSLNSWWSTARLIAILVGAACILIPIAIIALVVLLIVRRTRPPATGLR